ncbi:MAG: hypothetical protein AB7X20_12515 [Alphaproteobacteria bacterium]
MRIALRSPPGAIHAHGLGYLMALFEEARRALPDAAFDAVIDCDDDAARAHRALASGVRLVAFRGHPAARRRLESVAAGLGATLLRGGAPAGACTLDDPERASTEATAYLAAVTARKRRPRGLQWRDRPAN